MIKKVCPQCGKTFDATRHSNQKHCSSACWQASKRITIICPGCGKPFTKMKSKPKKYCSAECAFKHRPRPPRTKRKTCICEWCGKKFETWQSRKGRFCSHQCTSEFAATQTPTGKRSEWFKYTCTVCGKSYEVKASQFKSRGPSKYCSNECRAEAKAVSMQGDGNPNYRGGTILCRGSNWGRQRRKTLKRDNYRCQICGRKLKKRDRWVLDVHHIIPFREFDNYLDANQLSNLITLCKSCHSKVEFGGLACPQKLL